MFDTDGKGVWQAIRCLSKSLAGKFATAIFFFSLIAGVLTTVILSLVSYNHSKADIREMGERIHQVTEKPLTTSLWLTNEVVTNALLDSLISIPGVEQIELATENGDLFRRGQVTSSNTLKHSHSLYYEYQGRPVPLGHIDLIMGLDHTASTALEHGVRMALPIIILAVLGGVFSFLLFYFLIGRHLQGIAQYSAKLKMDTLASEFSLKRPRGSTYSDELDYIVAALDCMRKSLQASFTRIKKQETKYRALVDNSSDGIVSIDNTFRITYANPAACNDLIEDSCKGISGHEHTELSFIESISKPIEQAVRSVVKDAKIEKVSFELPSDKGGRPFEMLLTPGECNDNQVQSVVGIARDISTRKKSEHILRVIFRHLPMMMSIKDLESDKYIEVNDRFIECFGYSREQIMGRTPLDLGLITTEDCSIIAKTLAKQGYIEDLEINLRRADGAQVICIYSCDIIEVGGSKVSLAVTQDVTEQRTALAEREKLERQLQQAMKMEAIGTLAGGIAHDFNNILSAILGYGQLALEQVPPDSSLHHDLTQVLQAGNRASGLVKQILSFSRQDQHEFRPLRLQNIVSEVAKLLLSTVPATIELNVSIQADCGTVMADAVQLHQVLMNLCTNARQAIGNNHGSIHISLREISDIEGLGQISLNPLTQGRYLELTVRDSGSGMTQEIQSRIFDPFFTTRTNGEGTGLGLAVTHGIITKHQGAITVESQPGEGTSFRIYLPVHQAETVKCKQALDEDLCGEEHILLVDDEVMLADFLDRALRKLGFRVTTFTSSTDALKFFHSCPDDIDLLVTDMTMPRMTGLELSREVRKVRADLDVILCTGYSEAIDQETALNWRINTLLMKPVTGKDIAQAVKNMRRNN